MNEEKIENMLSQLIKMVGTMCSDQQEMKHNMQDMKQGYQEMKLDMRNMKQDYQEMKQDMQGIQRDQHEIRQDIQEIKQDQKGLHLKIEKLLETKGEDRHQEIVARFKALENDHDFMGENCTE